MKCPLKPSIPGCSILIFLSPAPPSVHSEYSMMEAERRERGRERETERKGRKPQAPPPDDISAVLKQSWRQMQPHTCSELQAADQLCQLLYLVSLSEPKECVCVYVNKCVWK